MRSPLDKPELREISLGICGQTDWNFAANPWVSWMDLTLWEKQKSVEARTRVRNLVLDMKLIKCQILCPRNSRLAE
jgi:hypothetical protein